MLFPYEKREDTRASALPKDDSSPDLPHTKQEANTEKKSKKGRVAGVSFLELHGSDSENPNNGPLTEVDINLLLTFTELVTQDDREYIILKFLDDDREDSFNWSRERKVWITLLLCLVTLVIGLATTAYSS